MWLNTDYWFSVWAQIQSDTYTCKSLLAASHKSTMRSFLFMQLVLHPSQQQSSHAASASCAISWSEMEVAKIHKTKRNLISSSLTGCMIVSNKRFCLCSVPHLHFVLKSFEISQIMSTYRQVLRSWCRQYTPFLLSPKCGMCQTVS